MYRSRTSAKTPKRKPVKKDKKKRKRKTKTPKVSVRQAQKQDVRQSVRVVVEAPKPKPRRKRGTLQPKTSSIQYQQQIPQLTQVITERQAFNNDFQDVLNIRLAAQERGLTSISNNLGDLERRLNPNINTQNLTPPNPVPIPDVVTADPLPDVVIGMPDTDQFISEQPTPQQRIPQTEAEILIETDRGFVPLDEVFSRQKQGGFMDESFSESRSDLFSSSRPSKKAQDLYREVREGLRQARDKPFNPRLSDHEKMRDMETTEEEPVSLSAQESAEEALSMMGEAMKPPEPEEEKGAEVQIKGTLKLSTRTIKGKDVADFDDMLLFLKKNNVKVDKRRKNDTTKNRQVLEKLMIDSLGINAAGDFSEEKFYK